MVHAFQWIAWNMSLHAASLMTGRQVSVSAHAFTQWLQEKREDEEQKSFRLSDAWNGTSVPRCIPRIALSPKGWAVSEVAYSRSPCHHNFVLAMIFSTSWWIAQINQTVWGIMWSVWWFLNRFKGLTLVMHPDAPSKDVKVGVIDNFCISVASLHVLCAHAASSVSQPLFLENHCFLGKCPMIKCPYLEEW